MKYNKTNIELKAKPTFEMINLTMGKVPEALEVILDDIPVEYRTAFFDELVDRLSEVRRLDIWTEPVDPAVRVSMLRTFAQIPQGGTQLMVDKPVGELDQTTGVANPAFDMNPSLVRAQEAIGIVLDDVPEGCETEFLDGLIMSMQQETAWFGLCIYGE